MFSQFTIIPSHSFAVVVLTASEKNIVAEIHRLAMGYFLAAFDQALAEATEHHIGGTWVSEKKDVRLQILVSAGSLYATSYTVNGTDALATLNDGSKTDRVPIWPVGNDEFK